jgi:DNA-binding HxlR family transcriptional regulator
MTHKGDSALSNQATAKIPLQDARRPEAVERALEIFNDSWAFAVLQELFFDVRRFDEIQRNLQISRSVLTRRLKHLEDQQIIFRERYNTRPDRYEYRLTERGIDMYPIFTLLRQWGEKWLPDIAPSGVKLTHKSCKNELTMILSCEHCGDPVTARDVDYTVTARK